MHLYDNLFIESNNKRLRSLRKIKEKKLIIKRVNREIKNFGGNPHIRYRGLMDEDIFKKIMNKKIVAEMFIALYKFRLNRIKKYKQIIRKEISPKIYKIPIEEEKNIKMFWISI